MAQSIGKTNKNGTLNDGGFYSIPDVQHLVKNITENIKGETESTDNVLKTIYSALGGTDIIPADADTAYILDKIVDINEDNIEALLEVYENLGGKEEIIDPTVNKVLNAIAEQAGKIDEKITFGIDGSYYLTLNDERVTVETLVEILSDYEMSNISIKATLGEWEDAELKLNDYYIGESNSKTILSLNFGAVLGTFGKINNLNALNSAIATPSVLFLPPKEFDDDDNITLYFAHHYSHEPIRVLYANLNEQNKYQLNVTFKNILQNIQQGGTWYVYFDKGQNDYSLGTILSIGYEDQGAPYLHIYDKGITYDYRWFIANTIDSYPVERTMT